MAAGGVRYRYFPLDSGQGPPGRLPAGSSRLQARYFRVTFR